MLNFLTVGDAPSGVYLSQVSDVCRYLETDCGDRVRLVAFVSLRGYGESRRKLKAAWHRTWVIPAVPGPQRWALNFLTLAFLSLFLRSRVWMARGILACALAQRLRAWGLARRVIYDGRGAVAAEWKEYAIVPHPSMQAAAPALERAAVLHSDFRLGVSEALVQHWRAEYGYTGTAHVVVPCTLVEGFGTVGTAESRAALRQQYGFPADCTLLIYSGSAAGWQSLQELDDTLHTWFTAQPEVCILFLSPALPEGMRLQQDYPNRMARAWVSHGEVPSLLAAGDYGIMIREHTVTNAVASPTKFAEYLSCGLDVLISPALGDYTEYVQSHACGAVVTAGAPLPVLHPRTDAERTRNRSLAAEFTKTAYRPAYLRLLAAAAGKV